MFLLKNAYLATLPASSVSTSVRRSESEAMTSVLHASEAVSDMSSMTELGLTCSPGLAACCSKWFPTGKLCSEECSTVSLSLASTSVLHVSDTKEKVSSPSISFLISNLPNLSSISVLECCFGCGMVDGATGGSGSSPNWTLDLLFSGIALKNKYQTYENCENVILCHNIKRKILCSNFVLLVIHQITPLLRLVDTRGFLTLSNLAGGCIPSRNAGSTSTRHVG
jgi:hypothetical protein